MRTFIATFITMSILFYFFNLLLINNHERTEYQKLIPSTVVRDNQPLPLKLPAQEQTDFISIEKYYNSISTNQWLLL